MQTQSLVFRGLTAVYFSHSCSNLLYTSAASHLHLVEHTCLQKELLENISSHNITSETATMLPENDLVYTFLHLEMMDHVNERTFFGNVTRVRFEMMKRDAEHSHHVIQVQMNDMWALAFIFHNQNLNPG